MNKRYTRLLEVLNEDYISKKDFLALRKLIIIMCCEFEEMTNTRGKDFIQLFINGKLEGEILYNNMREDWLLEISVKGGKYFEKFLLGDKEVV